MGVNPDEVVAVGAAIQGGVLSGDVDDVALVDVTPLSLGIETLGGVMTKLIERNTPIPTSENEIFSTAADGQTSVEIHVLQGEREMAADNRTLGRFQLTGIPPAPRGTPQIEVTFDIDVNGILNVTARDQGTGKEQNIEIKSDSGLSEEEVEEMREEAEEHEEEDKKRRELAEVRNRADQLAYSTENSLEEHRDKLPDEDEEKIEQAIEELREVLDGDDKEAIENKMEALQSASYKLGEMVYEDTKAQQAGAQPGGQPGAGPAGAQQAGPAGAQQAGPAGAQTEESEEDEDVVDADYEVKDE